MNFMNPKEKSLYCGRPVKANLPALALPAIILLLWPMSVRAAVPWVTDWTQQKLTANDGGLATAQSAFGATATKNGDVKDVKADTAVLKAAAGAISDPNAFTSGDAAVEFQRDFTLAGPPDKWSVTLSGVLDGNLSASSPNNNVQAFSHVLATAFVEDMQGNFLMRIGGAATTWDQTLNLKNASQNLPILQPLSSRDTLPNGQYLVYVLLEVEASVDLAPLAIANADASFFNTLTANLAVQPAPDGVNTLALVSLVTALLATVRRLKREE
jgi:hypothetical protein